MPTDRTTDRSNEGKNLYAVRDADGRYLDIQSSRHAHRADVSKQSEAAPCIADDPYVAAPKK